MTSNVLSFHKHRVCSLVWLYEQGLTEIDLPEATRRREVSHNSPNSGAPLGGRDELWVGLLRLKGQVFDCLAPFSQSPK